MNSKELRQAAILLHDWYCEPDKIIKYTRLHIHPWQKLDSNVRAEAVIRLANYVLATVQEDGEEILTDEWLSSIGGEVFEYENDPGRCYCFHMDNDVTLNIEVSSRAYLWDVGNDHIVCELKPITTRSQLRSLMTGLGIEPQKISEKR